MYFLITRMREKGVARPQKEIRFAVPLSGDINVRNEMCEQRNRTSDIAKVRPNMALEPEPLPPLFDGILSGMATGAFTLSGIEEVDGCLYAQSWWSRPV